MKKYRKNKKAFQEMFDERQELLARGVVPHNPQWDRQFFVTALRNTQRFIKDTGKPYPEKGYNSSDGSDTQTRKGRKKGQKENLV